MNIESCIAGNGVSEYLALRAHSSFQSVLEPFFYGFRTIVRQFSGRFQVVSDCFRNVFYGFRTAFCFCSAWRARRFSVACCGAFRPAAPNKPGQRARPAAALYSPACSRGVDRVCEQMAASKSTCCCTAARFAPLSFISASCWL